MNDSRMRQLGLWVAETLQGKTAAHQASDTLQSVSGDASFRRYFRARTASQSYIAVDAPPEVEDCHRFVDISTALRAAGIHAPEVHAVDYERGFMLLQDLGDRLYLQRLQALRDDGDRQGIDELYRSAIESLLDIQTGIDKNSLDPYDAQLLRREMALFEEWFCGEFLELALDTSAKRLLADTFAFLEKAALSQTQVTVHRDYHSRNLMLIERPASAPLRPGVIDFQDAVRGPYSYDLVSLLRDAYIAWPEDWVQRWVLTYRECAIKRGIIAETKGSQVQRDFDLMGMQRQLKVIGIFARLAIRDKKPGYLADIPLVIDYLLSAAKRYREMDQFVNWFEEVPLPQAQTRLHLES